MQVCQEGQARQANLTGGFFSQRAAYVQYYGFGVSTIVVATQSNFLALVTVNYFP